MIVYSNCECCENQFTQQRPKSAPARFCSRKCSAHTTKNKKPVFKENITEIISLYEAGMSCRDIAKQKGCNPSIVSRSLHRAGIVLRKPWEDCNKKVLAANRKGPLHHNFKTGRKITSGNYVRIYAPDHPEADKNGYILEHRLVWFRINGPIPKNCDIHHINGDRQDNRIENLIALTKADHLRTHNPSAMGHKGNAIRWHKKL